MSRNCPPTGALQPAHPTRPLQIGVFDSGLGGLSILRAIHARQPSAQLVYVADSGHAPYGERPDRHVIDRSLRVAAFLHGQGADVLVVACNTATALAVQALREAHPGWPIVGVEPGIKPAAQLSRNQRVGVLATEGTLRSERFALLAQAHAAHVDLVLQPCPGLAAQIELGELDAPELLRVIELSCAPLRDAGVDTVVLGCTHYPLVASAIASALDASVQLIDTADAVARQTEAVSPARSVTSTRAPIPRLWSTGDAQRLRDVAQRWLTFTCTVGAIDL